MNVQAFLGYKSTEDPLYRADKLMVRAAALVDDVDYFSVVEAYKDKADNGTSVKALTGSHALHGLPELCLTLPVFF